MPPKKQTPTLSEVARIAGVSQMTVSRALNNQPGVSPEKREEILRISDDMGYVINRVAQKLSGGRTRIIGVIAQLHSLYTSELVLGVGSATRAAGYEMLVYSLGEPDKQPPGSIIELLQQIVDGVIVILPFETDYLGLLANARLPIVTIDQGSDLPFPAVTADNYHGACLAMQHLAELGHKRIGFITGNERLASARERYQAYRDMTKQLGLACDDDLIARGDFLQKAGYEAAKGLMALAEPPTAIFAANDVSAAGAFVALREAGKRVPDDVSVIGFDDVPLANQLYPALSTIRQPLPQMARAAVNILLAMIAGLEAPSQRLSLPTQLVARGSTAAAAPSPLRSRPVA